MRRYTWIVLGLVLVGLVLWTAREHFEATQSIKAPPYDDAEKLRIFNMLSTADQATLLQQAEQGSPDLKAARDTAQRAPVNQTALDAANRSLRIKAAELVTPGIQTFFAEKYRPATVPITNEDVRTYVAALPATTLNKTILESILKTYFVGQSGVGTSVASGYAAVLQSLGQGVGYLIPNAPATGAPPAGAAPGGVNPQCPSGMTVSDTGQCEDTTGVQGSCPPGYSPSGDMCADASGGRITYDCPPDTIFDLARSKCFRRRTNACPTGYTFAPDQKCYPPESAGPMGSGGLPGSAMTSSGAPIPGNTTGGSSTSVFGPTSGGRGTGGGATGGAGKFMVWGPIGGGRAEGDGVQGMDSSKTNKYPELLGGLGAGGDKTRIDGVGLTEPSSSWQLSMSGLLPDMKSLGADGLSKFLPFSRTPGDMEKIPDPYRVNQTFRTSSYTSKTEPVPFLADFSAFQK